MIRERKMTETNIKIEPADREKNSGLVRQNTETNGLKKTETNGLYEIQKLTNYKRQKLTDYMKYRN